MRDELKVLAYCLKNRPKTIGILGLARSGKDTVGNLLAEQLDGYVLRKYAEPLKNASRTVFGHSDDSLKHIPLYMNSTIHDLMVTALEEMCDVLQCDAGVVFDAASKLFDLNSISPRILQQGFGDAIRAYDPDRFVTHLHNSATPSIITDVRFGNELCDYNILVYRKGVQAMHHCSEAYAQHVKRYMDMQRGKLVLLDGRNIVLVDNSGTLEDLKQNLIG